MYTNIDTSYGAYFFPAAEQIIFNLKANEIFLLFFSLCISPFTNKRCEGVDLAGKRLCLFILFKLKV